MPAAGPSFRLLFLADSQLGCMATFSGVAEEDLDRFVRRGMCVRPFPSTESIEWDVERFRQAIQVANALRPDVVVIGGDMIDATDRPDQLEAFRATADDLDGIDLRYVAGNHDACHDGVIPTEASLEWYRHAFGPDHWSLAVPLGDRTLTLIAVNSTLLDQPRKVPGGDEVELAFLEQELAAAAGRGPVVVFSHHPPFVADADEADNYWNLPRERRRPFLDLLAEHHVDLLLCGHRHRNDRVEHRGVEIVTSSAVGFPLGLDPPGYRMVEITDIGIEHTYYGVDQPGWAAIGGPPVERDC
jgi:3',5'-cyclic AMP phosphodiesterase CpdA